LISFHFPISSVKQGPSHYLPIDWPRSVDICYPRTLYLYKHTQLFWLRYSSWTDWPWRWRH